MFVKATNPVQHVACRLAFRQDRHARVCVRVCVCVYVQSLEQQVSQLEASLTEERNAHNAVSMQLTTAQHNLECLQAEHKTLQGMHASSAVLNT